MTLPQSLIDMFSGVKKLNAVSHKPPPAMLCTTVSDKATRWSAVFSARRHEQHEAVAARPDLYQPKKEPSTAWNMVPISTA